jgi:hypothetical protein
LLSGIGLAFFAGRLARADDSNDFLGIFHPPGRVNDEQNPASDRGSQPLVANFSVGVLGIVLVERFRVTENSSGEEAKLFSRARANATKAKDFAMRPPVLVGAEGG